MMLESETNWNMLMDIDVLLNNKLLDDIIIRRITPEEWFLENPE